MKKYSFKNVKNSKNGTKFALSWLLQVGHHYGTLTRREAIDIAQVNRTTFERWERGLSHAPLATLELLRLHAFGQPPNHLWEGWRFVRGELINNDYDYALSEFDAKAAIYWQPLANKLACELSSLKLRLEVLQMAA